MRVEASPIRTGLRERVSSDIPSSWYHLPPRRPSLIPRTHLVEQFLGVDAPVVVVSAPAGYGKTTAVMMWAEADTRPFGWVQVTVADNDPVHLGRHIALALDAIDPISEQQARLLLGCGRSPDLDIFPSVARALEQVAPAVLVLDDVHLLMEEPAIRGVEALLSAVPPGSQIVVIGRHLPIHLGRHQMGEDMAQVATDELAMDATEARLVLEQAGLRPSDADLADLVTRTEGWPGGLHLAALAIGPHGSCEQFGGRARLVADYLVEEVLASTNREMVEFLERSATLEYMDAEVLDDLLERSDSARVLAAIEASGNLFLVPLDNERRRYRYHHLFRDVLRARLRTSDPMLAQRLDSRASVLLERAGDVDGAIRHAVSAHEEERAANLILRATFLRLFDGRHAQVGDWLALLPEDVVDRYPAAAVAMAWYSVARGAPDDVVRACTAAARFGWYGALADGSPSLPVALAAIRIFLGGDGVDGLVRDAEIIRDAGGPRWNPFWALATGAQGTAYSMLGQLDLARRRLTEALAVAAGAPFMEAAGTAHLALLSLYDGDHVEADRLATKARRIADDHHLDGFAPTVGVYAIASLTAARSRRPDDARSAAAIARSIIARLGEAPSRGSVFGLLMLAHTAVALGDRADARLLLREAQWARRRDPSATFLNYQLDLLTDQLSSAGDLSTAEVQPLTSAELRFLDYLPTHLSLKEIAAVLLISRNTAKSHSVAIYRKLAVSSRADAVGTARRLGLLPER